MRPCAEHAGHGWPTHVCVSGSCERHSEVHRLLQSSIAGLAARPPGAQQPGATSSRTLLLPLPRRRRMFCWRCTTRTTSMLSWRRCGTLWLRAHSLSTGTGLSACTTRSPKQPLGRRQRRRAQEQQRSSRSRALWFMGRRARIMITCKVGAGWA